VLVTPSEIAARLPELRRLYLERKAVRGGAGADFEARMVAMIEELVTQLAPLGRAAVLTWELGDIVLAADLVLAAGGNASAWLGGFGTREARFAPGKLTHLATIEWAHRSGLRTLDLGPGDESYKDRFSDSARGLQNAFLRRRNLFPINTPVALVPRHARALVGSLRNRLRGRA
jgi:CelD/BcsL family acetyltransferase involved in cellulose biosynthesis